MVDGQQIKSKYIMQKGAKILHRGLHIQKTEKYIDIY